jgi:hypothetical protein
MSSRKKRLNAAQPTPHEIRVYMTHVHPKPARPIPSYSSKSNKSDSEKSGPKYEELFEAFLASKKSDKDHD